VRQAKGLPHKMEDLVRIGVPSALTLGILGIGLHQGVKRKRETHGKNNLLSLLGFLLQFRITTFLLVLSFIPNKEKRPLFLSSKEFLHFLQKNYKRVLPQLKHCPEQDLKDFSVSRLLKFADTRAAVLDSFKMEKEFKVQFPDNQSQFSMVKSVLGALEDDFFVENEQIWIMLKDGTGLKIGDRLRISYYTSEQSLNLRVIQLAQSKLGFHFGPYVPRGYNPEDWQDYYVKHRTKSEENTLLVKEMNYKSAIFDERNEIFIYPREIIEIQSARKINA